MRAARFVKHSKTAQSSTYCAVFTCATVKTLSSLSMRGVFRGFSMSAQRSFQLYTGVSPENYPLHRVSDPLFLRIRAANFLCK